MCRMYVAIGTFGGLRVATWAYAIRWMTKRVKIDRIESCFLPDRKDHPEDALSRRQQCTPASAVYKLVDLQYKYCAVHCN